MKKYFYFYDLLERMFVRNLFKFCYKIYWFKFFYIVDVCKMLFFYDVFLSYV